MPVRGPVYMRKMSQKFYKWQEFANRLLRIPFLGSTLSRDQEESGVNPNPPDAALLRREVKYRTFFSVLARRRCWWLDCGQPVRAGLRARLEH